MGIFCVSYRTSRTLAVQDMKAKLFRIQPVVM